MRLGNLKWQAKRNRMLRDAVEQASASGHRLHPWLKGKFGFRTSCSSCGQVVRVNIGQGTVSQLSRCENPQLNMHMEDNMRMSTEDRVRSHPVCPLCLGVKDAELVVCWRCYRVHGLRNGNPQAEAAIRAFGERLEGEP